MHSLGPIQAAILRKGAAQKYQVKQRPHVLLQIVAEGRPEQVAKTPASYTGRFLASALMPTAYNNGVTPLFHPRLGNDD